MSDFTKYPTVEIKGEFEVFVGWENISAQIQNHLSRVKRKKKIVVVEYYQGVLEEETTLSLKKGLNPECLILSKDCMWAADKIKDLVHPYVTNDRIFGYMTGLEIDAYFDPDNLPAIFLAGVGRRI